MSIQRLQASNGKCNIHNIYPIQYEEIRLTYIPYNNNPVRGYEAVFEYKL